MTRNNKTGITDETGKQEISIPQLRAALKGRVIAPDDAEYDKARTVFYGGFDRRRSRTMG